MADSDLFKADPTDPLDQVDDNVDPLSLLVGEDKKFKTPADLAKSKLEADRFIETLKRENAELREREKNTAKLGDVLERLSSLEVKRESPVDNRQTNHDDDNLRKEALTPEKIDELINQRLQAREQEAKARENVQRTVEALKGKFGNDYLRKLEDTTAALGMTKEEMNSLAATRPALVLTLLGVDKTPNKTNELFTPPSSNNPRNMEVGQTKRDQKYYDKLKKDNPALYKDPKTQIQMHKDAIELQEAFFNS